MNTTAFLHFESVNLCNTLFPHKSNGLSDSPDLKKYRRGDFIYHPNDVCSHIYLISEGSVKIGHFDNNSNEVVKSILGKGEIFGELALAGEDRRKDFAVAVANSLVCPLAIKRINELMFKDHELSFRILKLMGLRLMRMERKLELLISKDARTRIVEFLKDSAACKGKKFGYETAIFTTLTHKDIAALTGTSRQTVTTVLNELRGKNLINFDRKKILIRDLSTLA